MMNDSKSVRDEMEVPVDPVVAALELQDHFRLEAKRLCYRDWAMQEDLVQEMSLALLKRQRTPMPLCFFKDIARKSALNFMRDYERRRYVPVDAPCVTRNERTVIFRTQQEIREEIEEEKRSARGVRARLIQKRGERVA